MVRRTADPTSRPFLRGLRDEQTPWNPTRASCLQGLISCGQPGDSSLTRAQVLAAADGVGLLKPRRKLPVELPLFLPNCRKSVILTFMNRDTSAHVQLSPRGQLTLPAKVRRALGLEPGDDLVVFVEEGRAILEPAVVVPIERYGAERIREFQKAARMSPEEIKKARRKWRL